MSIASILESAVLSEGNLYINARPRPPRRDMTLRFTGESVALALPLSDADMHPVDLPFSAAFVYPVHGAEIEEHLPRRAPGSSSEREAYENVMPDWALEGTGARCRCGSTAFPKATSSRSTRTVMMPATEVGLGVSKPLSERIVAPSDLIVRFAPLDGGDAVDGRLSRSTRLSLGGPVGRKLPADLRRIARRRTGLQRVDADPGIANTGRTYRRGLPLHLHSQCPGREVGDRDQNGCSRKNWT